MKLVERRYISVVSEISQFNDKSGMEGRPFFYGVGGAGGAYGTKIVNSSAGRVTK